MRVALPLAALALLAVAQPALASDYMLPVLLEPRDRAAAGGVAQDDAAVAQGGEAVLVGAGGNGVAMGAALLGAALVVAGAFAWVGRLNRGRAAGR